MQRHVFSNSSADGYHASVAAHAPDIRDVFTLLLQCIYDLGQYKRPFISAHARKSHQLTRAISHVCNKKTTKLSNYKRHAVSLVYRTITHTACRFFIYALK
ncbi:putative transcription factor C2H2 family [Helianthus anomalus]